MRRFHIHVAFSALTESEARGLSQVLEMMVATYCHRDQWSISTAEEPRIALREPVAVH